MKYSLFKYQTGILYGSVLTFTAINPERGPSTGGQEFVVSGGAFEYPTFDDTFISPALDLAKWVDISAGGGSITTGTSHLQLTTGAVAGAVAGVEMLTGHTNIQYECRVNIPTITSNPTANVNLFQMQNYIDANNYSNMIIRLDNTGTVSLICEVYLGGALRDTSTTSWTTGFCTLKMLRWYNDVYFYANGSLILHSMRGSSSTAKFRFFAANLTANYNVYNSTVEYVINRPYVAFDNQVVHDLELVSDVRARGVTPPSIDNKFQEAAWEGLVDVSVVSNITQTRSDFYEYFYVDSLTLLNESQFGLKLSEIDDETVRTPVLSSRGLGGGR